MQVNCTHSGGEVWQGLNMKQLLINDLQIICCPFRWTKRQRMKEVMKQSPFLFLYWFLLQILTVSSGSSSDGHQARSAREAARYPVAPLGSPFFRLQWGNWHPPVHRPESGKKGTCPGSSAPGPLHHRNTAQTAGIQFQITGSRAAHVQTHITQSLTSRRASPWLRTPSSSSTCHMPTAWTREWTHELCCNCQSTSSVPTQHRLGKTNAYMSSYMAEQVRKITLIFCLFCVLWTDFLFHDFLLLYFILLKCKQGFAIKELLYSAAVYSLYW